MDMLNRLYFKDAQINLKECVFDKVDNKVNELIEIKTLFAEVRKLMPELNLEQINQNNVDSNEDILKLLDSNLDKVSDEIINKLNKDVFDTGNHVIMVLRDLNHWKGILSRLKFQSLTYDKRNVVLGNLNNYFKELKQIYETKQQNGNDFLNDDDAEEKTNDKNIIGLSSKISLIISAHSLKQKCANAIKLSTVLNDLKDYNTFQKNALTLQKNIEQYIEENIADWNGMFIGLSQELPKLGEDIVEIYENSSFLKINFP
jgi:hypothetical protein